MNPAKVAVIMYHYVRPIKESQFPNIRGLEFTDFLDHLDYLKNKSTIISPNEFKNMNLSAKKPDHPYSVLTFDDGLLDHFEYVFPELLKRNLSAFFFPSSLPLEEKRIASVHQIHYILEAFTDARLLLKEIKELMSDSGNLNDFDFTQVPLDVARYDQPTEKLVKFILQRGLSKAQREQIVSELFKRHVSRDPSDFLGQIYMSENNVAEMKYAGMEIGSHGATHDWLEDMSPEEQENDINQGIRYISRTISMGEGAGSTFAYPYGSYNQQTLNLISTLDISHAFTTKKGFFELGLSPVLEIPRFDANDLYNVF